MECLVAARVTHLSIDILKSSFFYPYLLSFKIGAARRIRSGEAVWRGEQLFVFDLLGYVNCLLSIMYICLDLIAIMLGFSFSETIT